MLGVLEDIKNRAPDEYQYFGRKAHLHRRQALEALGPDADKLKRLVALNLAGLTSLDFEEFPHMAIEYLTEANENRDGTFTDVSSEVMKTRPQYPFPSGSGISTTTGRWTCSSAAHRETSG